MEEGHGSERWIGYVDWRNRPAMKGKHGGMVAASFVLVVEVMENLAYLANASNLVLYLVRFMHMSPTKSANTVTNFMGTAFLLALVGGFLSDAFFTTYHIYLISAITEFLGLVFLTVQAWSPSLKPSACDYPAVVNTCQEVSGNNAAILFAGLYLVALGVGGIKGSLPAHGAEQFDESTADGRKKRSTFFNYFVFCLAAGALIAVTVVVWVEDNMGWQWGFGISTATVLLSVPVFLVGSAFYRNKIPNGSPLTTIAKVIVAVMVSRKNVQGPSNAVVDVNTSPMKTFQQQQPPQHAREDTVGGRQQQRQPGDRRRGEEEEEVWSAWPAFLNRASEGRPTDYRLRCTMSEVEEVKTVAKVLPIFLSTIMLNCCLAQLSTFSVEQAAAMDTRLGGLTVPPASLPLFPVVFIMVLAPLYDQAVVPLFRRLRRNETGITHLQRIGVGLLLSVVAMAAAALVEAKRKRAAASGGGALPPTFLWIAPQYLCLGSADLFTLGGLLEFFFTEAPARMRSLATSLSFASLAMGYYLSSVLVSVVNGSTRRPWLVGDGLDEYELDRFYWLMCVLSALNYLNYLFWALRYKYTSATR